MKISPLNFSAKYKFKDTQVEYVDLSEIIQGGPEIGKLFIDKQPFLKDEYFGGPMLYYGKNHSIILPIHASTFLNYGFKIIVIDLISRKYKMSSKKEKIILFKSIKNNVLEYYSDLENTKLVHLDIGLMQENR